MNSSEFKMGAGQNIAFNTVHGQDFADLIQRGKTSRTL